MSFLYPGPKLVKNLCGTLLRFRLSKVAIIADIEKAYLQLELAMGDRDVTRFLWLKVASIYKYNFDNS